MTQDPIDIADQRLASGEIDHTEHQRITTLIRNRRSKAGQTGEPAHSSDAQQSGRGIRPDAVERAVPVTPPASGDPTVKIILGVLAVVATLTFIGFNSASSDGLSVGQLSNDNGRVSMKIANTSTRTGDVLLYVQYDGVNKCEHLVELRARGNISNLSFPCEIQSSTGKYHVRYAWADTIPEMSAVANRISVDW